MVFIMFRTLSSDGGREALRRFKVSRTASHLSHPTIGKRYGRENRTESLEPFRRITDADWYAHALPENFEH